MREDVLIILNEREPLKQKMAALLVEQLHSRGYSCDRLRPTASLGAIISERAPRILVLDYLLGDEGTAFDTLAQLHEIETPKEIATIIWTDEPNVSVAVNAIKLGASDYIELGSQKDLDRLLSSIDEILERFRNEETRKRLSSTPAAAVFEEPVAQAALTRRAFHEAELAVKQRSPIVTLFGPAGSGKNTLGREIHRLRRGAGTWREIALENWLELPEQVFGTSRATGGTPYLSASATVFIDHIEFDCTGELLEACTNRRTQIWKQEFAQDAPVLIVGTSCEETATAWQRFADSRLISLPGLSNRAEDIFPLLQRFSREARRLAPINRLNFSHEFVSQLAALEWPNNIRELKAVTFDVLLTPEAEIRQLLENSGTANTPQSFQDEEDLYFQAFQEAKLRFEARENVARTTPTSRQALEVFEKSFRNLRLAAAKLGVGIPQIRQALSTFSAASGEIA